MINKNWHNGPNEPLVRKVWFITGASRGLGLALVKQLLVRGDKVAATTRFPARLAEEIQNCIPTALARNFLSMEVDLSNEFAIAAAIDLTHQTFGRLDVVVNNAGYTLEGAMEDLAPSDIHQCFTINSTAAMTVMHKAFPYFRQQRSGFMLNISSLSTCASATDSCIYAATKYATMGLSELMTDEARKFNLSITVVVPAAFQSGLHAKEYDMLENLHSDDHAATGFILLAEQPAPPPILLVGNNIFIKAEKPAKNDTSLRLHDSIK